MTCALVVALAGGCTQKSVTENRSSALPTAKERGAFLCAHVICPTPPEESAFHITRRSGGPFSDDEFDVRAVVKVAPDEVAGWRKGCSPRRVDRPPWLDAVAAERGWKPNSVPDTYVCGPGERRIVHVREALVIIWATSDGGSTRLE